MSAHKTHTALDPNQSKRIGKIVAKGIFLWHYKSQGIGDLLMTPINTNEEE